MRSTKESKEGEMVSKIKGISKAMDIISDFRDSRQKVCPNCGTRHTGMFDDCYSCFDCTTEEEYKYRREEALERGTGV